MRKTREFYYSKYNIVECLQDLFKYIFNRPYSNSTHTGKLLQRLVDF